MDKNETFTARLECSLTPADKAEIKLKGAILRMLLTERMERGLSQAAFAKLIGVQQPIVCKWEQGELNITIKTLSKACAGLELMPKLAFVKECKNEALED